jgi:hypothetical protein
MQVGLVDVAPLAVLIALTLLLLSWNSTLTLTIVLVLILVLAATVVVVGPGRSKQGRTSGILDKTTQSGQNQKHHLRSCQVAGNRDWMIGE